VTANYRCGLVGEAQNLWGRLAALPRFQNDLRVKQVHFDLALENKDWSAVDDVVKDIQRIEGPGGPLGNYAQGLWLLRQADAESRVPPREARELLERAAATRPQWLAVKEARAELEVKSHNYDEAILRLREALDGGESRNPRVVDQ